MARARPHAPAGIMIRRMPEDRRRRTARLRGAALAAIGAIAVSGVVFQEMHDRAKGQQVAAGPAPFDYFPG